MQNSLVDTMPQNSMEIDRVIFQGKLPYIKIWYGVHEEYVYLPYINML